MMKNPLLILNIRTGNKIARLLNRPFSANTMQLLFASLLLSLTTSPVAANNEDTTTNPGQSTTAYVDSIHQWGPWELDIEPAAGGLTPLTTQPLNARGSKLSLRTNSISALAPQATIISAVPNSPVPAPPVIPVTPPPPVVPPIGGPADGLF